MQFERIKEAFPALGHRNYRLFWFGQCVSLIGTWMQNVGQAWLVLQLTGSPWLLGVVGALQFAPMLLLSLFAGVLIDRFPKRRILLFTQSVLMLQALILAALVGFGVVKYWHIVVLALVLGLMTTLDHPTRQAYVVEMVGKEDLMNAIALNSSVFNAARVIGPAVAGLLMGFFGTTFCFVVNGLSFIAVIIGLWKMTETPGVQKPQVNQRMALQVKEGLRFVKDTPNVLLTLVMVAVISLFGINFNVLVPVFAQGELGQQAGGYGFLMSALGMGALIGAVSLAAASRSGPRLGYLIKAGFGLGIFQLLLGLQHYYAISMVMLALMGWSMIVFNASANTTIQLYTPDHLRGRVMSLYSLVLGGVTPFGSLFAGGIANRFGAGITFVISGLIVGFFIIGIRYSGLGYGLEVQTESDLIT
jgi:MFS family permease